MNEYVYQNVLTADSIACSWWSITVRDCCCVLCFKDAEVELQETDEYQAAKQILEETRALAGR